MVVSLVLLLLRFLRAIAAAAGEFSITRLKNSFSKIIRKQQRIDENAKRINKKRIDHHDYQVGDMVKLRVEDPTKLENRFKGPYWIQQVNTNGTVLLQTRPGITTPINIRKLEPYRGQL